MSSIKRNLSSTSFFDDQTKRLRRNTCLEDLSNELFYEIFDYFDGCHMYDSFSNLNIRLDSLVKHSSVPLKIKLSTKSQSRLERRCQNVIIPNEHRILSLRLRGEPLICNFLDYYMIHLSFNRLESIVLNELSTSKLTEILIYLHSLPRLVALTIHIDHADSNHNYIYQSILSLPYLKYNKLSVPYYGGSLISVPQPIDTKLSTIEHLVMNVSTTLNELISILIHTPHLRHLTCKELWERDETNNEHLLMPLKLPELIDVFIEDFFIKFDEFEMFIKKISSKLEKLRLHGCFHPDYMNGNRWQQLIEKHMPYLREFHFYYDDNAYLEDVTSNIEAICQFTSAFWTERYWCFEFKDSSDEITYSIHPKKKMWFDRHADRPDIKSNSILGEQQNDKASIPSIQLTIDGYKKYIWDYFYIDGMKPYFDGIQFTHLNIDCKDIPINLLIEIIHLLPNLETLNLISLPFFQLNGLPVEVTKMLSSVSNNNKITKVKLEEINEKEQFQFLACLCPRIQYLEVECVSNNDLENIVERILNVIDIPDLCSLCLCTPPGGETIIKKLYDIIINFTSVYLKDAKRFSDYMIQRGQDKIFLDWKI